RVPDRASDGALLHGQLPHSPRRALLRLRRRAVRAFPPRSRGARGLLADSLVDVPAEVVLEDLGCRRAGSDSKRACSHGRYTIALYGSEIHVGSGESRPEPTESRNLV